MRREIPRIMQEKMERRAGLFILITVVVVAIVLFVIGSEKNVFKKRYELTTTFEHGGNIDTNTAVTLSGLKVGNVSDIYINDKHEIEVVMSIQRRYQEMIREDSVATLVFSLLTGSVIDINIGASPAGVLKDGGKIVSAETTEIADKVGVKVLIPESGGIEKMINDDMPSLLSKVNNVFGIAENLLARLQDPSSQLNRLSNNLEGFTRRLDKSNMIERSEVFVSNAGDVASDMKDVTERLPVLFTRLDALLVEFNAVMDDLRVVSRHLRETSHELPDIIESAEGFIEGADEVLDASKKSFLLKKHIKLPGEQTMIIEDRRDVF